MKVHRPWLDVCFSSFLSILPLMGPGDGYFELFKLKLYGVSKVIYTVEIGAVIFWLKLCEF